MNVEYVVKNQLCIGCGLCEIACPNNAVKMILNINLEVPLPSVDRAGCCHCHRCLNVCYGYKVDNDLNMRIFHNLPTSTLGNFKRCYLGYADNQALRSGSASGGAVTAFLNYALKKGLIEGAIVTVMDKGNPPRARAFIAATSDDVLSARGSKYCPVSFAECLRELENGKKYAVVGLPCHIYGIRRLSEFNAKIRDSISMYLGILCGGMPNYFGTLYILRNYNMEKQFITNFEYRGGGWPGRLLIRSKEHVSKKQTKICAPYPGYWNDAFSFFVPYRCTLCHDGFNEFSDISFGDAWLPHLLKNNAEGMSLIITRTEGGEKLIIDAFKNKAIRIDSITSQEAMRSQNGLIRFKVMTLGARFNLYGTFRKNLPVFDSSRIPEAKFEGYISAMWLYLGRSLASKRILWRLFDIHIAVNSLLCYLKKLLWKI